MQGEQSLESNLLGSFGMSEGQSAISTTLDEIQSLRILENELAKTKSQGKETIDEESLENQLVKQATLNHLDSNSIESLVQAQVQEQANVIE